MKAYKYIGTALLSIALFSTYTQVSADDFSDILETKQLIEKTELKNKELNILKNTKDSITDLDKKILSVNNLDLKNQKSDSALNIVPINQIEKDLSIAKETNSNEKENSSIDLELLENNKFLEKLTDKLVILEEYEQLLKNSLSNLEYSKEDSLTVLKEKQKEIEMNLNLVITKAPDLKDTLMKESTITTLETTLKSIDYDIENYVSKGQKVVNQAMKYLGIPYVWGGRSETAMDCSGLTLLAYQKALGIDIGGWTVPQESSGTIIPVSEAQVGDLLFWGSRGSTHHVAIYTGNNEFIHAPQPSDVVKITNMNYFMPDFAVRVIS